MTRSSSVKCATRGLSGASWRTVATSADANRERARPSVAYRTAHRLSPSETPNVPCTSGATPRLAAVASMRPTVRSSAWIGSSSSPNVSASRNTTSVSVDPVMSANRIGSIASMRSRRMAWKSPM